MSEPEREIRRRIAQRGRIPFSEAMEVALYGPGGYYDRRELPIGPHGDFVTGSSLSPLFGRSTARVLRRVREHLGLDVDYLEAGYGNGAHLAAVVEGLGAGPARLRGWDRVSRPLPAGVEAIESLAAVDDGGVRGLVFYYELFDALPVHRLVGDGHGGLEELWVAADDDGELQWSRGPLSRPQLAELVADVDLEDGQIADVAPGAGALYAELARKLGRGLVVTCDYGFERRRLFDARLRRHGTLACYSGQRVHRDPFVRLGRQDLTAHVDFTTLRAAGEAEGLETVALTRQALWLLAGGVFDDLEGADLRTREQAMALLDGEGMGEEIRVLVQARDVDPAAILDLGILAGRR